MTPQVAFKLWLILDAVTRSFPALADELSAEEWMQVSKHIASFCRCPDCGGLYPGEHVCTAAREPAIIV